MVLVLVLVDTVARLVLLQDLIQPRSLHVVALRDHVLAIVQGFLMVLLFRDQPFVEVELIDKSLAGAGIEHINYAGLDHFVESYRIMPAVVEDF